MTEAQVAFLKRLKAAGAAMSAVLDGIDWSAFDRCDCGHLRAEHMPGRLHPQALAPCHHGQCDCLDYDDIDQRAAAWKREQKAQAERQEARLFRRWRRQRGRDEVAA